jgi:hypothetical protein
MVQVDKHLSGTFPVTNGLKQGHALLPLFLNLALEYAIRRVQANQESLKLNGTYKLLVYTVDVNLLGESIHTLPKRMEYLLVTSKEIGLEVNAEQTKYMFMSHEQKGGQYHKINSGGFDSQPRNWTITTAGYGRQYLYKTNCQQF